MQKRVTLDARPLQSYSRPEAEADKRLRRQTRRLIGSAKGAGGATWAGFLEYSGRAADHSSARAFVRRHPISSFFLLAVGISWLAWIPFAAAKTGLIHVQIAAGLVWLAEFGPLVAALLLTGLMDGVPGVRQLARRLLR
jgi:hypothetical protein